MTGCRVNHRLVPILALLLTVVAVSSASESSPIGDCRGVIPNAAGHETTAGEAMKTSAPPAVKGHLVTLSWTAGVPAHVMPKDPIVGYRIFRRESDKRPWDTITHDPKLVMGTNCVDYGVQPGHTYYYSAKSVSAAGRSSEFSKIAVAPVRREAINAPSKVCECPSNR